MKYVLIVNFQPGVDRDTDGRMEARGDQGPSRLLRGARARARGERRARRVGGPRRAGPRQDRDLGRPRRAGRHRRPVPGIQGVGRRLPDRRRRDPRRGRSRSPAKISAVPGPGGRATAAADHRPPDHGGRRRGPPRRWRATSRRRAEPFAEPPFPGRGPASHSCAAGPRRAHPTLGRFRRRGRRRPGGAHRRRRPLAARRDPAEPARVAADDGRPTSDRSATKRAGTDEPGVRGRPCSSPRRRPRPTRTTPWRCSSCASTRR